MMTREESLRVVSTAELSPAKKALLERRLKGIDSAEADDRIPPRKDPLSAPLSHAQRQMWVIDQMMPGNPAYNLPTAYRIRGPLDVAALERSINAVIRRHESLRTTFSLQGGEPRQRIHPEANIKLEFLEFDDVRRDDCETQAEALATVCAVRPFDLSRLPLIRATVFALDAADHVLILDVHHIAIDGLSIGLLMKEVDAFYRMETGLPYVTPPELRLQYADFAEWQHERWNQPSLARQLEYWRTRLAHPLPVLDLPASAPRPPLQSFAGSNAFFTLSATLVEELNTLARANECTPFMVMLAAFQVLLARYTGSRDVVIGSPISRRPDAAAHVIGNFLNVLPVRCDASGDPTFVELLARIRESALDAFSNGDVPFDSLLEQVMIDRDPSRNPAFQVMLQVLSERPPALGDLDVSNFYFDFGIAQFDLSLHLYAEDGGYTGRFEYCSDLFTADTMDRMATNFVELCASIVRNPAERIATLDLVSAQEANQLAEWNSTATDVPAVTLSQLFEAQVDRTPNAVAVIAGRTELTYAELESRANRLARLLESRGIGAGQRVGLSYDRTEEMVVGLLAVLKTGAAYVPLDPLFPQARLHFMQEDAQLAAILGREEVAVAEWSDARLATAAKPDDVAYVIYTSGSTGQPKGVSVSHFAAVNLLTSMAREPGLTSHDVLVAVTTLSFDIALLELMLPLVCGATVVIATREDATDGQSLRALLDAHHATVMQATPSTWRMLIDADWIPNTPFKALVGGEPLPRDLVTQLVARGAEVWNMYGPTETTVWSTCARATADGPVTIGRPIANTSVVVLDANNQQTPIGVPGEAWIGGAGVALGYHNRDDLTAAQFVPAPFDGLAHDRFYRTGDLVRWLPSGELEHLGRIDRQLKLRGLRIEPGEVEHVLARHPGIAGAVVDARTAGDGEPRLVAYVVFRPDVELTTSEIRKHARASLPDYMVPGIVVPLTTLPRTPNGKIDRRALPDPFESARAAVAFESPTTNAEEMLAEVWRGVLNVARVGRQDNFFELGGHSLAALRVVNAIEERTGVRIDPRRLFFQTLAQLAPSLEQLRVAICR